MPRKKKTEEMPVEEKVIVDEPAEEKPDYGAAAAKAGKIILGILIVLGGLFLMLKLWSAFVYVFLGLIGVVLIVIGLVVIALGWTD